MRCYLAVIILVFTVVGLIILAMGFCMHGDPGTGMVSRSLELKLLGVFFIVSPWISIYFLKRKLSKEKNFTASIMETGTRKSAVLVSCEETGTWVNEAPEVEMVLAIEDDDGTQRNSVFKGVISRSSAATVMPGMTLEITESEKGMVIHWPEKH